jgi:hypothetical protein
MQFPEVTNLYIDMLGEYHLGNEESLIIGDSPRGCTHALQKIKNARDADGIRTEY